MEQINLPMPSPYRSKVSGPQFDEAMEAIKVIEGDVEHLEEKVDTEVERLDERINGKENKVNKVNTINSHSTEAQYPSAKCVYDTLSEYVTLEEETLVIKNI